MKYLLLYSIIVLLLQVSPVLGSSITYEYDEQDRLHIVTLENGIKITYEYDEIGNMTSKKASGVIGTITANAMLGGAIYPNGSLPVNFGSNQVFSITPSSGYMIESVYVDGVSQGAISSYTFSNINASHTITAYFKINTATCSNQSVRLARATPVYYSSIQAAYNAAVTGDVIQAQTQLLVESLNANRNITVTIDGGYSCNYSTNPDVTYLLGSGNLTSGVVTLKNIQLLN